MNSGSYSPAVHRTALLTAAATLVLIFMGGMVTSKHAGMSVPDWPNSYGYNMFTFPPSIWLSRQAGGIFYEHSHRLMGTVVGMLSIALTVFAWLREPRRWVRWLCTGVLGAVIFQGVLGGLRVVLVKLDLAIVHACVAQAFFCLTACTCVATSKWWTAITRRYETAVARIPSPRLIAFAVACVFAIYSQLIVGATMRHYGAGLAIPDLPLAYGHVLPPPLAQVNQTRIWDMHLAPVTLGQLWLHFGHRIGAVVVTIALIALSTLVLKRHRSDHALRAPAILLLLLLATQLTLGVLTVLLKKPADLASSHVAVGALVLAIAVVLTSRAARLRNVLMHVAQPPPAMSWHLNESQPRAAVPQMPQQEQELAFV